MACRSTAPTRWPRRPARRACTAWCSPRTRRSTGCALLRVTTASKDAGLDNATGIGFWSAQAADGNQAAGGFRPVRAEGRLKAGGPGDAAQWRAGDAARIRRRGELHRPAARPFGRLFKPYMQFPGAADGRIFRNWDIAENYRISPATPAVRSQRRRAAVAGRRDIQRQRGPACRGCGWRCMTARAASREVRRRVRSGARCSGRAVAATRIDAGGR